jgi:hypothetical protein
MLLFNEKNQAVNIKDIKSKLRNLKDTPVPTKDEVCTALGNYYNQSLQIQAERLQFKAELSPSANTTIQAAFLPLIGSNVLAEIKKIVCGVLDGTSTEDQIIDAILSALVTIIPGGVFIETLAKIVVKYVLATSITLFCEGTAPNPTPAPTPAPNPTPSPAPAS